FQPRGVFRDAVISRDDSRHAGGGVRRRGRGTNDERRIKENGVRQRQGGDTVPLVVAEITHVEREPGQPAGGDDHAGVPGFRRFGSDVGIAGGNDLVAARERLARTQDVHIGGRGRGRG